VTGFFFVVAACALWALDTLIRYPLMQAGVEAISVVFYEHLLLTVIFITVFFKSFKNFWKGKPSHLFYFFIVGGVGSAFATVAFTRAFIFLNPSLVILLQKFQPIVAIILARVILKEEIKRHFVLWALVCLLGAFLISFEDIMKLGNSGENIYRLLVHPGAFQGYVLVLFSILGWASATVFGKKLGQEGFSDEQIMGGRFVTGFLCLLPLASLPSDLFTHNVEVYSKIALMVLVSGLLAMYLYYQGLRRLSARTCSLAEMFFPFMAVIVNWLFLNASLSPVQILGGAILILGSMVIQLKRY
jgi:drug/metabolite transporter (DMT)-like permease